jgi:hypothetical protein
MNRGRNRSALKVRGYLQLLIVQQQLKLVSVDRQYALATIFYEGAARYVVQLCSIQNSNQTSDGLSLGFEGRLVQMSCNFTEIWAEF